MIESAQEIVREGFEGGFALNEPARRLDTTGQVCPYPALMAKEALDSLGRGEVLEVVTNNRATATRSIPALCRRASAEFIILRDGPEAWRALIRRP